MMRVEKQEAFFYNKCVHIQSIPFLINWEDEKHEKETFQTPKSALKNFSEKTHFSIQECFFQNNDYIESILKKRRQE